MEYDLIARLVSVNPYLFWALFSSSCVALLLFVASSWAWAVMEEDEDWYE